jgi:hypothetical protein
MRYLLAKTGSPFPGWLGVAVMLGVFGAPDLGMAADSAATLPQTGTIGYVLSDLHWGTYPPGGGQGQCPQGFNAIGPQQQFEALYPKDGTKRTVAETKLNREIEVWFPADAKEQFPFHEATAKVAFGMNLDDKIGPNDFNGPDGEKGVDNQLYRVLGCERFYGDTESFRITDRAKEDPYNRLMIELTGVDNLTNSSRVQVTTYRGLDPLLTAAGSGKVIAGGSQRIDTQWGKKFIQHLHGRIVDGILITEPADVTFPWSMYLGPTDEIVRGARLKLKVTPDGAEGIIAGYTDIETWYRDEIRSYATAIHSYQNHRYSPLSVYKALHRLADGYPDPKTGENTAISSAILVKFAEAFIVHPPGMEKARSPALTEAPTLGPAPMTSNVPKNAKR